MPLFSSERYATIRGLITVRDLCPWLFRCLATIMQQTLCDSNAEQNVTSVNRDTVDYRTQNKIVIILKLFYNCSKVHSKTNAGVRQLLSLVTSLRISVTASCAALRFMNYSLPIPIPAVITFDYIA
jgi:hypothetical protein